jgi:hypothetical protein
MRLCRFFVCSVAIATLGGCAAEHRTRPAPSYQNLKQQELSEERKEFIEEARARLVEVNRDIAHLDAKLKHESEFVDASERAEWNQELFELKQQRSELNADLERAKTVTLEQWEQMRGRLGVATDSLQAGVRLLTTRISRALASNEERDSASAPLAADSGLCPVEVQGAEAEVEQQDQKLVVRMTTNEESAVPELQRRAREMAKADLAYRGSRSISSEALDDDGHEQGHHRGDADPLQRNAEEQNEPIRVNVGVENIEDGVELVFSPKSDDLDSLKTRLEQDAQFVGKGRCQGSDEDQSPARAAADDRTLQNH